MLDSGAMTVAQINQLVKPEYLEHIMPKPDDDFPLPKRQCDADAGEACEACQ